MHIDEIQIGSPLYEIALELRYNLFFKEFDLPKKITADEMEAESTHNVVKLHAFAWRRLACTHCCLHSLWMLPMTSGWLLLILEPSRTLLKRAFNEEKLMRWMQPRFVNF